jgi:DNA-binding MarR family transcriptional regulator
MMDHLFRRELVYPGGVEEVEWLSEQEERAWRSLQLMQMRLTAALARQLAADSSLSYADYVVLVALTAEPDGRMRAFELGRSIGWEQSRLSHHVGRMVARGLVRKEKCPSDQRGSFVVVTDEGRRQIREAAPGHVEAVRRLFVDRLSDEELHVVGRVSDRVLAGLESAPECTEEGGA